ncbi:hypothetical protein SUGI_0818210 [Cryptomeria japonica]|uniref:pentatricopeptide repeat-containing protein At5g27460 n=1 Tax=Cryptomeria japonica TaxID=3369 RepID=UPI002414BF12|nr:pentatricopeptide repeat-containing protein At5g27460 [Cryptomeria japonica]GLJ39989.1 hypothetical protein SUGI_0818210 [Cryptomeria japonica]
MRLALIANAFKRLGVQGFGKSVCQQRSPYDGSRAVFPLFLKTFSSAEEGSVENTGEPVTESRIEKLPKGLFWKVFDRTKEPTKSALDKWLNDGKKLKERDLQSLVRGFRNSHNYKKALEVSQWMQNHPKFVFTPGDYCIMLDLIERVYGIDRAEKCFQDLPEISKNEITYCALLDCYAKAGLTEKAEHWMEKMQELGFTTTVRPYNTLMKCYLVSDQMEKILSTIKHLKKIDVQLNSFSYRLWINACASMSKIDDAEKIVDEIKSTNDSVDWTVYTAVGDMYIKSGLPDKAKSALKEAEKKIGKGDRRAYDYLITMNASLDDKEEVYRLWNILKTSFDKLYNTDYISVLSSLAKSGDIEGVEKIFKEWETSCSSYDFRVSNILLAAYVRGGMLEKAESFHSRIAKERGEPICKTWEILAQGYLNSKQMDKAVTTMLNALRRVRSSGWKPRSENVIGILKYLEEQGNVEIADEVLKLLRDIPYVTTEIYNLLLSTHAKAGKDADEIFEQMVIDKVSTDKETDRLRKVINDNKPSG